MSGIGYLKDRNMQAVEKKKAEKNNVTQQEVAQVLTIRAAGSQEPRLSHFLFPYFPSILVIWIKGLNSVMQIFLLTFHVP